jgi:hypothetical protein
METTPEVARDHLHFSTVSASSSNIAGTFAFSSTLSIFLKPITEELGVSRGAFH